MRLPRHACGLSSESITGKTQIFGFDTETYYEKGYDVRSLGVDSYVADCRFHCYLVSFWGPCGHYVGSPEACSWHDFSGAVWVSHNSRFDRAVFRRLKELGIIPPDTKPVEWHDSAALASYLQAPRNLEGASRELLGIEPDKSIRDRMKGVKGDELRFKLQDPKLLEYALQDARLACELWLSHSDKWPEHERLLSQITVEQGEYGIQLDHDRIMEGVKVLTNHREESAKQLPWFGQRPPSSLKALKEYCQELKIPPPPSTAEDNPACDEWVERYGKRAPWISHIRNWRKANRMLRLLERMRDRCRPDGSLPYSLKYFGAIATGRWSGDAGLNVQNLNRKPLYGVEPRSCLIARPDHKLIIADLSQIEPRVLAWLVGDVELLERIRNGLPLYQAHAEATMGFRGMDLKEEDPQKYLLAKCRVIGLGYGAGAKTFQNLAKSYGLEISFFEATTAVNDFRKANPKIPRFWRKLEKAMREKDGETFFMTLPSGRVIRYFEVDATRSITATTEMGGRLSSWYGGKLCENIVQATARDIFAEGILRLHRAGIRILWSVHDEVICEVPDGSDIDEKTVCELLARTPDWMPGLPVEAEAITTKAYCK